MVAVQGKLFAAGGMGRDQADRRETLNSVECFDPATGVWTNLAPLKQARDSLRLVAFGTRLYVIGGRTAVPSEQGTTLSSVECLDLTVPNSQWTTAPAMLRARDYFGVAQVTEGKFYAIGGRDINSIECFDSTEGPLGRWASVVTANIFPPGAAYAAV